jgi:hypothetical protein
VERLKGKRNAAHHAKLLAYMFEQAKDVRQRVEILLALLNSIFATAKTGSPLGYLNREQWVDAHNRVVDILKHVEDPAIVASLTA